MQLPSKKSIDSTVRACLWRSLESRNASAAVGSPQRAVARRLRCGIMRSRRRVIDPERALAPDDESREVVARIVLQQEPEPIDDRPVGEHSLDAADLAPMVP